MSRSSLRLIALLAAALFCAWVSPAQAGATCFWVGGSGTWNTSNTASWATTSGGSAGSCTATNGIPENAGDIATFDGNSTGTVTVGANFSICEIRVSGTFSGTINFGSTSQTLSCDMIYGGASSGTINCGTATFTITNNGGAIWNSQGFGGTESCASATIVWNPASPSGSNMPSFSAKAGGSYGTFTITTSSYNVPFSIQPAGTGISGMTIGTFNITNPIAQIVLEQNSLLTITNAPNIAANLAHPINFVTLLPNNGQQTTITTPNTFQCQYCFFNSVNLTNATTLSNAWSGINNTNVTATPPTSGGSPGIIGG